MCLIQESQVEMILSGRWRGRDHSDSERTQVRVAVGNGCRVENRRLAADDPH